MRAVVLLAAGLLAGCASPAACPAVGWTNTLRVELGPSWEGPESVRVAWDGAPADGVTAPLTGSTATVTTDVATPGSVTVTVLAAHGTALAEHPADLDWVRVGGSAECGGPSEATVVFPAP